MQISVIVKSQSKILLSPLYTAELRGQRTLSISFIPTSCWIRSSVKTSTFFPSSNDAICYNRRIKQNTTMRLVVKNLSNKNSRGSRWFKFNCIKFSEWVKCLLVEERFTVIMRILSLLRNKPDDPEIRNEKFRLVLNQSLHTIKCWNERHKHSFSYLRQRNALGRLTEVLGALEIFPLLLIDYLCKPE